MRSYFILAVLVLLCYAANAQNTLKGHVADRESLPIEGATVFIPELNRGTISDKSGYYEIQNIPNGKIRLRVSFVGFTNENIPLTFSGIPVTLNVTLEPAVIEAEEIVVSGGFNTTQHENAVKIDVLKLDPLEGMATPNFTEKLTQIPGVDMISKGSGVSKPVIRGLSMNDILVLNNGVRFENYQYSSHHPLGIDECGIDDVEVIKGPASLLYGSDAIGGVINFIKEKPALPNTLTGDYNVQLFSNSLGMSNNLGLKGASRNFFGGLRFGQQSHADYLQGGGSFVPNSRWQEYSVKTNGGYLSNVGSFKLYYDYSRQNLGLVEDEPVEQISERGRKLDIFYQQLNTHLLSSQNKLYLGHMKLDINSAYQNTELTHFAEPDVYEIQMDLSTLTYETKLYLPSDNASEYIVGFQGSNQINSNLNNRETKLLPDAHINNYSGFGLLQHTFFDKLKLQTGIRYDFKTIDSRAIGDVSDVSTYRAPLNKTYGSFSGSFGATYNWSKQLLFRVNIASAYRTPNLAELTSNGQHETRYEVGDQHLVPENSYEADWSMHYHRENVSFDLAAFYNLIDHYIFISPTGDTTSTGVSVYKYMQQNSRLFGGEAGMHFHPSQLKWMHFETTFSSVVGKQKNGDYLPFIPAHKLKFELRAETDKLSFLKKAFVSVASQTAFNQNNAAPDETTTPGYTLLNFGLGANIKSLMLSFSITNVFDKKYVDHLSTLKEVGMYNPGRNVVVSLRVPFGTF